MFRRDALFTVAVVVLTVGVAWLAEAAPDTSLVQSAQAKLKALGYDPGAADGAWGAKTQEAIKRYQGDNKLPVTGELDDATRGKLGVASAPAKAATGPAGRSRDLQAVSIGGVQRIAGNVFVITPPKNATITGDCHLKFACRRVKGTEPIVYRPQVGVPFTSPEGTTVMWTRAMVKVDGKYTSEFTWPASKSKGEVDFSVSFKAGTGKISGKGTVLFLLDAGRDAGEEVLSNIVAIDCSLP